MSRKRARSDKRRRTRSGGGGAQQGRGAGKQGEPQAVAPVSGQASSQAAAPAASAQAPIELEAEVKRGEQAPAPLVVDRVEAALSPTDLVSLGHSFRRVTELIEEVGRTLEAQNQRAQRLMERLEGLARTLEVLPHEAERQLEALDAVQRSIEASVAPTERLRQEIGRGLPEVANAVREGGRRLEQRWAATTEVVVAQLGRAQERSERRLSESARQLAAQLGRAQTAAQRCTEQRLAELARSQRWQTGVLAGFACALLVTIGAIGLFGFGHSVPARRVEAAVGGVQWRVERVEHDANPIGEQRERASMPVGNAHPESTGVR